MLGYACARMRCYYPIEFATAYLNRAHNEEKINMGTELASVLGFDVNPPKFRYSKDEYMFDKDTGIIYKGLSSIKYLNKEVALELYELRNNTYNNFYELLIDLQNTSINSRQLDILIRLDFFEEFGKARKLLKFVGCFDIIHNAKVISKNKVHPSIAPIIAKNARETAKQYRDLNNSAILNEMWNMLPNEDLSAYEIVSAQREYLGYINYINPELDKRYIMVLDLNTKYSPRFTAYCLNNGKSEKMKVYRQPYGKRRMKNTTYYSDMPFKEGDVLYATQFQHKNKSRKVDGKWVKLPEKEWWIKNYTVVI